MGQACTKCGARRIDQQLGLERTPEEYVAKMVEGFREVRRVLRKDGTCWVNLGDSYSQGNKGNSGELREGQKQATNVGSHDTRRGALISPNRQGGTTGLCKQKDLIGIPWMVAFALRADGWWLRQDIIWAKPNPMPESVTDRCTKAHEYIFLLTKSERYFYDAEAIKDSISDVTAARYAQSTPMTITGQFKGSPTDRRFQHEGKKINGCDLPSIRNKRSVWTMTTKPFPEAHFATFPPELPETCIKAGTSEKGCCPKCGAQWERITDKSVRFESGSGKAGNKPNGKGAGGSQVREEHDIRMGPVTLTRTLGWQPTCTCNAGEPVPCVVMDQFSGAGTVRMVAMELGCDFIGCELNPDYIKIGYDRTWARDAQPSLFEPKPEQMTL